MSIDDPYELGYVIEDYDFTKEGGVSIWEKAIQNYQKIK